MEIKKKKAVMYGAGNIGRGFIAQLFCMSGYETVFIDINEEVVFALNRDGTYPLYITDGDEYGEFRVSNVRAVNGKNAEDVAREFIDADIVATAVGANVLKYIAKPVAEGIRARFAADSCALPFNIIICENLMNADKYFYELVSGELEETDAALLKNVGFVEASVGRMVPATPNEISQKEPLAVCAEPFYPLPVDADAVVGSFPEIENIIPSPSFSYHIKRKLYMHNMAHTAVAYHGYMAGYEYIWEAVSDKEIQKKAKGALGEISQALSKEYGIDINELEKYSSELLKRFENKLLGDTVVRVGRDTQRKLARDDRITGALLSCEKNGIRAPNIAGIIAAAFEFNSAEDPAAALTYSYAQDNGIAAAVEKFCGIDYKAVKKHIEK